MYGQGAINLYKLSCPVLFLHICRMLKVPPLYIRRDCIKTGSSRMAPGELPKYRRSLSPNIVSDAKKIRNESKEKKERKRQNNKAE
jgi:hypothetical protein